MLGWLQRNPHNRYQALLSEHVDGRLDSRRQAEMEAHLASCASCQSELAELQATVALLRRTPMVEPPRSFALPYAPRQAAPVDRPPLMAPLRAMQMATVAASVALAVVVATDLTGVIGGGALAPVGGDDQVAALQAGEPLDADSLAAPALPAPSEEAMATAERSAEAEPMPSPEAAEPSGRPVHEWVELSLALVVSVLAIAIVLLAWGLPRRRPI